MKIFKNFKMPILAIVLGLGLVLSQSAFKATTTTKQWGLDMDGVWHDLSEVTSRCELSTDVCKGEFNEDVNPNEPISPQQPNDYPQPISTEPGTFVIL